MKYSHWHLLKDLSRWLYYIDIMPIMLTSFELYYIDTKDMMDNDVSSNNPLLNWSPIVLLVGNMITVILICVHFVVPKKLTVLVTIAYIMVLLAFRSSMCIQFNRFYNIPNFAAIVLSLLWTLSIQFCNDDESVNNKDSLIRTNSKLSISTTTATGTGAAAATTTTTSTSNGSISPSTNVRTPMMSSTGPTVDQSISPV